MIRRILTATVASLALVASPVVAGSALATTGADSTIPVGTTTTVHIRPVGLGETPTVSVKVKADTSRLGRLDQRKSADLTRDGSRGTSARTHEARTSSPDPREQGRETATGSRERGRDHRGTWHAASTQRVTGTVEVTVEGTTLTAALSKGRAQVAVPLGLAAGQHPVTVRYLGSASFAPSTAQATLTVAKARVSLRASTPLVKGAAPVATVTASSAAGTPTGDVTVTVARGAFTSSATAALVDGKVTVTLPDAIGTEDPAVTTSGKHKAWGTSLYRVSVTYAGSDTFAARTIASFVKAVDSADPSGSVDVWGAGWNGWGHHHRCNIAV